MPKRKARNNGRAKSGVVFVTVEIMLTNDAPSYDRGDVIDLYRTAKHDFWQYDPEEDKTKTIGGVKMPRTGYVHIRAVPSEYFPQLRRVLRKKRGPPRSQNPEDLHSGEIIHKRRWQFQIPELATPVRNELLTEREITRTWIQFKKLVKHKIKDEYLEDVHFDKDNDPDSEP